MMCVLLCPCLVVFGYRYISQLMTNIQDREENVDTPLPDGDISAKVSRQSLTTSVEDDPDGWPRKAASAPSDANVAGSGEFGAELATARVDSNIRPRSMTDARKPQTVAVASRSVSHPMFGATSADRTKSEATAAKLSHVDDVWEICDVERNFSHDSLEVARRDSRSDHHPDNRRALNSPQTNRSTSSVDGWSIFDNDEQSASMRQSCSVSFKSPQRPPPDLSESLLDIIQAGSNQLLTDATSWQCLTTPKPPGQKIASVDDKSSQRRAASLISLRQKSPVVDDGDELEDAVTASNDFDIDDYDDDLATSWQSLTTPKLSAQKIVSVDDKASQRRAVSFIPLRQKSPAINDGSELEHAMTASNDFDIDDDDDDLNTESIRSQLRQLQSSVMDQKEQPSPPASIQSPEQEPSQERTKRSSRSQTLATRRSLSPKLSCGVAGRPGRTRTYDQPTISATAKQAGPIFTWNRPSNDDDNAADTAGSPSTARDTRKRPQLDDRQAAGGSTGSDAAGKPAFRGSSYARKFGNQAKGTSKSASRKQAGTAARQSRSAAEPSGCWSGETLSDDVQLPDPSDPVPRFEPNPPSDFGGEISQLAARLHGCHASEDAASPASRSSDSRHRSGRSSDKGRRRNGGSGKSRQTVEDVYVEAMSLDAEGRVSGQESLSWRQELGRIIDSLRHQLRSRDGAKSPVNARMRLLTNEDIEESKKFTPVVTRQRNKR